MTVLLLAGLIFGFGLAVMKIGATRIAWGLAGYYLGKRKDKANGR